MKTHLLLIIILIFITCLTTHAQRTQTSFDRDWKFQKTSDTTATNPQYNDASWRTLNLPHDWSIEDRPTNPTVSAVPSPSPASVPPLPATPSAALPSTASTSS